MTQFTVEEMNLLSIYHEGSQEQLRENMNCPLPAKIDRKKVKKTE